MKIKNFYFIILVILLTSPLLRSNLNIKIIEKNGRLITIEKGRLDGIVLGMRGFLIEIKDGEEYVWGNGFINDVKEKESVFYIDKIKSGFNLNKISSVLIIRRKRKNNYDKEHNKEKSANIYNVQTEKKPEKREIIRETNKTQISPKIMYLFSKENYISENLIWNIGGTILKMFHPTGFHKSTDVIEIKKDEKDQTLILFRTTYRTLIRVNRMDWYIKFNNIIPIDFNIVNDTGAIKSTKLVPMIRGRILIIIINILKRN